MMVLPLPSLIVINTTTNHHHIPEDETEKLTPHVIELFLEQIRNESAPVYKIFFLNKFKILYVVRKKLTLWHMFSAIWWKQLVNSHI